jgi:16S rRNA (guanine527-N7)-methyltransferase
MLNKYINHTDIQKERLEKFYQLHKSAELNLTTIKEREGFYIKHYLDSVYIFTLKSLPLKTIADIGSGGGFPGIVLAVLYPEAEITLVESIGKKCRFLEQAVSQLGLSNVNVKNIRAESLKGKYDLITARGVAKVKEIIKWTKHLAHKDTLWLLYKGGQLEDELKQAKQLLRQYGLEYENVRIEEPFTRTYTIIGGSRSFADGVLRGRL